MNGECLYCGDELKPGHTKFCSKPCSSRWNNAVRRGHFDEVVPTSYGSHGFDGLVASWLRSAPILGSTLIGA